MYSDVCCIVPIIEIVPSYIDTVPFNIHVERGDPGSPAAVTGRYHSVRLCIPVIQCRTGAAVMVPS